MKALMQRSTYGGFRLYTDKVPLPVRMKEKPETREKEMIDILI